LDKEGIIPARRTRVEGEGGRRGKGNEKGVENIYMYIYPIAYTFVVFQRTGQE